VAVLLLAIQANADVASQSKWHPIAAAHLDTVFVTGLEPIDWTVIEARFATNHSYFSHRRTSPVYALLEPIGRFAGSDPAKAIRQAIANKDALKLRLASAKATSIAVRYYLDRARGKLDRPSLAVGDVLEAQAVYNGLASHVRKSDPKAHRALGLAWLDLATDLRTGQPGAAVRHSFNNGAQTIERHLRSRFEDGVPDFPRGPPSGLPPDALIAEQNPLPRLVLNFEQRGIDERKLFFVAYGDMLFDSPEIFGEPARSLGISCATCHNRSDINQRFYIPGLSARPGGVDVDSAFFQPNANDHRLDPLDIPSLRGIRFTGPYGRNGRTASLREFTRNVIIGEFNGPEPTPRMLDALVAYLNEFDFLPVKQLDRSGMLNNRASQAAKRGESLFQRPFAQMGGRSCASCHMPSSAFLDGRRHDIGSGKPAAKFGRDGAFDTPTLLGAAFTAPYFHDGSLAKLADVVDWFDTRFNLKLEKQSKADLVAYLETIGGGEQPFETFDDTNTRFRMTFGEISVFLSTLDTLIPARDEFHADLLIRTVARDLRADASGMWNTRQLARVHQLADELDHLGRAIASSKWNEAERLWRRYKKDEERHAAELY
jgi:cytochrome c peroxidase